MGRKSNYGHRVCASPCRVLLSVVLCQRLFYLSVSVSVSANAPVYGMPHITVCRSPCRCLYLYVSFCASVAVSVAADVFVYFSVRAVCYHYVSSCMSVADSVAVGTLVYFSVRLSLSRELSVSLFSCAFRLSL